MGMGNKTRRAILGLSGLLLAGAGLRCTNSDVLSSEPGQVTLTVQVNPAGPSRYGRARLSLVQILFRPEDPAADAALGAQPYSFVTNPVGLDLTSSAPRQVASLAVNEGVYRVVGMRLQEPSARDFPPLPQCPPGTCTPMTCLDCVLVRDDVDGMLPPPEINTLDVNAPIDFELADFNPVPTFRVERGGRGTLTLTIDGPGFLSLFESAFQCQCGGVCSRGNQNFDAPCMTSYTSLTAAQLVGGCPSSDPCLLRFQ